MTRSDLEYIRQLNYRIAELTWRREELWQMTQPSAIRYDSNGCSHPMPTNKMEEILCKIERVDDVLDELIDERHELREKAVEAIQAACSEYAQRHILYLRYLACNTKTYYPLEWSEGREYVEKHHNIKDRRIRQLHHDAVLKIERYHI